MYKQEIITRELILLSLANMCYWASLDIFLPVLPRYYQGIGLDTYGVGLIVGALSAGGMLFRVVAGRAVDRYGSAVVACAGLLLSVAAIWGYFSARSLGLAVLCSFSQGVGMACYSPAATTMATLMFDRRYVTDVIAVYSLFGMIGASFATAAASIVYDAAGMPVVIGTGGLLAAGALLLVPKRPTVKTELSEAPAVSTRAIAGNPGVYIPTFSTLANGICFAGLMVFLPLLMLSRQVADFNIYFVTYAIVVVAIRVFVRQLCDRFGALQLEWLSVVLIGLAMFFAVWSHDWVALALCGVITGLSLGVAFPAMGTTIATYTDPKNRGAAFGIFTTASDIGFVIGATGLSFVAATWGYAAVFMLSGGYALLYAVIHRVWLVDKLKAAAVCNNC